MLAILGLASTPLMRWADTPPSPTPERITALDGLRGFLALGVFFHHAAVYHAYLAGSGWALPPSRFYALLGQAGVALFFMLTGFLFWSRLLERRPDWTALYIGRVFRIGPLYLATIAWMCAIAVARTGGPHFDAADLGSLAQWSALGIVRGGTINGYTDTGLLTAGVTWTLQYEWLFYLALLPLSLLAGRRPLATAFAVAAAGFAGMAVFRALPFVCMALFGLGMTCGSLRRLAPGPAPLPAWATSTLVLALLAAAVLAFRSAYTPPAMILLAAAFYLVSSGCTVFGLLTSRPVVRLGNISFGVYLLQGLVLTLMFVGTPLGPLSLRSPAHHWGLMIAAGMILVLVATAAHALIERPGIALGKTLSRPNGPRQRLKKRVSSAP
jgi:peptidoglycan/LPS O-acetylase OafA/YrhL